MRGRRDISIRNNHEEPAGLSNKLSGTKYIFTLSLYMDTMPL